MIIIWIIAILALLIAITVLINIFKNWHRLMNYKNLFSFLLVGMISLSILFQFTAESNIVRIIAYLIVIISSLFYGAFKKRTE